jgi:hypothetical protein
MQTKIKIFLASVFVSLGFGGLSQSIAVQKDTISDDPSISPNDTIKGVFSRKEIKEKLKKLSETEVPIDLTPGAMCYKMVGPPERAEYVCPVCGTKTLYTINTEAITREIPSCRFFVSDLKSIDIKLDESQFCKKCSPKVKNPELCIEIKYTDESEKHKTCNISSFDLQLVSEFLKGKITHLGETGGETPLKDYLDRIKTVLNIK